MAEVQLYLHHKVGSQKENYIPEQKMKRFLTTPEQETISTNNISILIKKYHKAKVAHQGWYQICTHSNSTLK